MLGLCWGGILFFALAILISISSKRCREHGRSICIRCWLLSFLISWWSWPWRSSRRLMMCSTHSFTGHSATDCLFRARLSLNIDRVLFLDFLLRRLMIVQIIDTPFLTLRLQTIAHGTAHHNKLPIPKQHWVLLVRTFLQQQDNAMKQSLPTKLVANPTSTEWKQRECL